MRICNQHCRHDWRPYNMYLTITSQCFESRGTKYCIFMHIACISDNSHHCKRTVLCKQVLSSSASSDNPGVISEYQLCMWNHAYRVASSRPLLPLSLHHPFLLPPPSHKKMSFLQSPSPSLCAADVRDGKTGLTASHLLTSTLWFSFVSTCNS